jgi:hypothetical protein
LAWSAHRVSVPVLGALLDRLGAGEGFAGRTERHHELVAEGLDLAAGEVGDTAPHDGFVVPQ